MFRGTSAAIIAITMMIFQGCESQENLGTTIGASAVTTGNAATPAPQRPIVLAASSTINFSSINLGSSVTQTITFVNAGGDLANLGTIALTASSGSLTAISKLNDTCSGTVLLVGTSCSVDFSFTPSATGSYIGFASLNYVSPTLSSYNVSLPYTGTATLVQPSVASNPASWDFGSVSTGSSNLKTFTIANSATGVANFQAATISGAGYSISTDACNSLSLSSSGGTCTVTVIFNPSAVGSALGTLTLHYTNSASSALTTTVNLSGIGIVPPPEVQSNPASWDFGTVTTSATPSKTFIISNGSAGSAAFSAASISGAGYSILSDGCNGQTKDNTNGTCNIDVRFSPSIPGSSLGVLTLNYTPSGGSATTKTVSLSGIGNVPQPVLTLSPNPHNFGNVATNTFSNQIITVSNNTTVSATIGTATISGSGYSIVGNTCNSIVLSAAANCSITVRFTPAGLGAASGVLTVPFASAQGINYTATNNLGGTGVAPTVAFVFNGFTGNAGSDSTNLTATGVTMQWAAQTAASYYKLTRTGGTTGTVISANLFPTSVATFNVTDLNPNTAYQFKVNAFDINGTSDGNNNWVTITTPNITGATFNGWSDAYATGTVFTDIGLVDTARAKTGNDRIERNLSVIAGFGTTEINTANDQIAVNRDFATGTKLTFRTDGTAPGGLTHNSSYYAIRISSTEIKLASTLANANGSVGIDLTSTGSGNMTLMPAGMVKLGWELFTFSPSGAATAYRIYRSTTAGSGFTQIGTSTTNSYIDTEVSDSTTYYYKVNPDISGTEVIPAVASDSEIRVFVPAQNMAMMHRWIANRDMCTNLLGFTFPAGVNRGGNYSCAYTWGVGFAPNIPAGQKSLWDIGYDMVWDRWYSGCKVTPTGPILGYGNPAAGAGTTGDVYIFTGHNTTPAGGSGNSIQCHYKTASGWVEYTGALTNPQLLAARTNYPGYPPFRVSQTRAAAVCGLNTPTNVVDGNGNSSMRLPRIYEMVAARGLTGTNINVVSLANQTVRADGNSLPSTGACNTNTLNGVSTTDAGVSLPFGYSRTVSGSYLTRNCMSRFDIQDLWGMHFEWLSDQMFGMGQNGGSYFVASSVDAGNKHLENWAQNGTMGPMETSANWSSGIYFYSNAATTNIIPMFGVRSAVASASYGTRNLTATAAGTGAGGSPWVLSASTLFGLHTKSLGSSNLNRYHFGHTPVSSTGSYIYGHDPMGFRCVGQVNP